MNTAPRNLAQFVAVPTILDLIAADAGVSPLFVAAICRVGSERWHEVRDQETADQRAEEYAERIGAGL